MLSNGWRLFYLHCRRTAAIYQSPDTPSTRRWLAYPPQNVFITCRVVWRVSITADGRHLPVGWVQMLAGLALLSTVAVACIERLLTKVSVTRQLSLFLVTASGLTLMGIGSAFWG
ncbi:benzoate/H(+) symporter BenE family transporter [Salmonella enterica subsp. enterica]|nr:benzoate/H(+) symporter BenE family transporter [Salmonella enterica subsp. enterica]